MPEKNYYDVLGISKTASQDEIKRAYRRLARKVHPDLHASSKKGEMEEKFKQLTEAYEVLKDPETRKKYDRYGKNWKEAEAYERAREQAGAQQGEWFGSFSQGEPREYQDFFEQIFGGSRPKGGGPSFRGFAMAGADLEASIELSLREVLTGTSRRFTIHEQVDCKTCHGKGKVENKPCHTCGGAGTTTIPRTVEVRIPAGVRQGERLKVAGKGSPGHLGGPRGNLYLSIHLKPHRLFHHDKQNVIVVLPVWPWEAALGTTVEVPTLDGPVKLKIPPKSSSGSKLRLKGKGLPDRSGKRGDQLVTLKVVVPSSLTDEETRLYEQLGKTAHPDPRQSLFQEAAYE